MADETSRAQRRTGQATAEAAPLRLLGDGAPFMLDATGRISSWSDGAQRLFGHRPDEIVGQALARLSPPEERADADAFALAEAERSGSFEQQTERVRKDGSRFPAQVVLSVVRDPTAQGVLGYAAFIRDLTVQRAAERSLYESEQRVRSFIGSVTDYAIFMLDASGRIVSWNAGAERLKGYRRDEVLGQEFSIFYTPEQRAQGRPAYLLGQARAEGRVEDEGWRVRKDGTRFWADVVITALRDEAGHVYGYAKVTRDLTEQRQNEERLRQSEERFRLLVEQVTDYAIFMLDPGGRVATWNAGAERIKGYSASEILGQHFSRFRLEEEVRDGRCEQELARAVRDGRCEQEGWRVRKDGSRFWASVVLTALRNPHGELLGFAKVTRDLTERRSAEEERLRLARAQESIRLRDEFLAIASHELKTPLTALQLQLQSLEERIQSMDAAVAKKLERATRSSHRLSNLVESLLDVSLLAVGRFTINYSRFDMSDMVEQLLDALRGPAQRVGSDLRLETTGPLPGLWDRTRIEQVLSNLIANAIKYGAGKPIMVSLAPADDELVMEVRDGGPGLAEDDLRRIFERFERAASLRHYGGLGLGLYLTREIVEAHGGSISVHNLAHGGACFVVRLPFEARAARPRAAESELH